MNKISLCDGKYSVINDNGKLIIHRHNERWPEKEKDYIGDGFVLSLVQKIEELEEKYEASKSCLNCDYNYADSHLGNACLYLKYGENREKFKEDCLSNHKKFWKNGNEQ
jgi:hypothetical protein